MEKQTISIILIITLIIIFLISKYNDLKNWEPVADSSGLHVYDVQAKFSYLHANGIKCRIKTVTPIANRWGGSGTVTSVRLEVHKKDLKEARKLLRDFN